MALEKLPVKLITNYGEISVEIYPQAAPVTVKNFCITPLMIFTTVSSSTGL